MVTLEQAIETVETLLARQSDIAINLEALVEDIDKAHSETCLVYAYLCKQRANRERASQQANQLTQAQLNAVFDEGMRRIIEG